jgi:hypothetical protein
MKRKNAEIADHFIPLSPNSPHSLNYSSPTHHPEKKVKLDEEEGGAPKAEAQNEEKRTENTALTTEVTPLLYYTEGG